MADEERKGITPGQWDAISNVEKPAEEGGGRVFDEVLKERDEARRALGQEAERLKVERGMKESAERELKLERKLRERAEKEMEKAEQEADRLLYVERQRLGRMEREMQKLTADLKQAEGELGALHVRVAGAAVSAAEEHGEGEKGGEEGT